MRYRLRTAVAAATIFVLAALSLPTAAQASIFLPTDSATIGSLAASGADGTALMWLWIGGGILLVAGGALAIAAAVRRRRG